MTGQDGEDRNSLLQRAAFGKQVEEFWTSDIGDYILKRIEVDVQEAFQELKDCDPKDGKLVQTLQNKIYRAESVKGWLQDAIVDGLQALNVLEDR